MRACGFHRARQHREARSMPIGRYDSLAEFSGFLAELVRHRSAQ